MRALLDAAEVPQPSFAVLPPDAKPAEAARLASEVGFPCIVKPTSLSGSQGVIRADTVAEALQAIERSRAIAANAGEEADRPLLIERFVPGPEVAVEAMLSDGVLSVLAVFDKPDPLDGPFFEETLYVTPSRLGGADLAAVKAATEGATRGSDSPRAPSTPRCACGTAGPL